MAIMTAQVDPDWVTAQYPDADPDQADADQSAKPPQASVLLQLATDAYELGQTPAGEPFAVPKPGHGPHVARMLRGRGGSLRAELARRFAAEHGRAPSQQALADAVLVLQGRCLIESPTELALRVASHGTGVVLDLGDPTGRAVVVTADGWRLIDRSPVLFRRTGLTGALPEPIPGGDFGLLRPLVNVDDDTWLLLVAWELALLLRPGIPHPVPAFTGEHGAAKTAAMWVTARWLDPSDPQTRQAPRDVEAWTVAAAGSMAVAIDNLSWIPDWFSDAICRAVTGDGLVKRALFTDDDLSVLSFRRCVLLAGIAFAQLRGDLNDRLIHAECEQIDEGRRMEDADAQAAFEAAWPSALGGLLDLAVKILAALPDVKLARKPRMADFARVVAATDQVLGGNALDAYLKRRQRAAEEQLEGDLVADAIRRFALEQGRWEGTAGELLAKLTPDRPPKDWPGTPRAMSARLKRAAPTLRAVGISVEHLSKTGGVCPWRLERTREEPPQPPPPPPDEGNRRSEPPSGQGGSRGGSTGDHPNRPTTAPRDDEQNRRSEPPQGGWGGQGGWMHHPSTDDAPEPEHTSGGQVFADTAAWDAAGRPGLNVDPATVPSGTPADPPPTHRCNRCGKTHSPSRMVAVYPHSGCGGLWTPIDPEQEDTP